MNYDVSSSRNSLYKWDHSSTKKRVSLCKDICLKHQNVEELEKTFGLNFVLFFNRVSVFFRLNYLRSIDFTYVIQTLALFIRDKKCLVGFVEVGGARFLLEIINTKSRKFREKKECLLSLIFLSNSGKMYKEAVCHNKGIKYIINSMYLVTKPQNELNTLYEELLLSLHTNNEKYSSKIEHYLFYLLLNLKTNDGKLHICKAILSLVEKEVVLSPLYEKDILHDLFQYIFLKELNRYIVKLLIVALKYDKRKSQFIYEEISKILHDDQMKGIDLSPLLELLNHFIESRQAEILENETVFLVLRKISREKGSKEYNLLALRLLVEVLKHFFHRKRFVFQYGREITKIIGREKFTQIQSYDIDEFPKTDLLKLQDVVDEFFWSEEKLESFSKMFNRLRFNLLFKKKQTTIDHNLSGSFHAQQMLLLNGVDGPTKKE